MTLVCLGLVPAVRQFGLVQETTSRFTLCSVVPVFATEFPAQDGDPVLCIDGDAG